MDSHTLKSVSDLPAPFRSTFSFRYFNSLQSECFPLCFHSDINMVVSAPTGSGKTVLFELCVLRVLSKFISKDGKFAHLKGTLKTIYVAPSKALVQEKLRGWNQKFGSWGISCLELTGDNDSSIRNIQEADIILTTPEKFDSVTRYHLKDGGLSFFSDIALLLIDEVHLLNDPRGAALEAIVSRIKMLARNSEMKSSPLACVRFLAASATIPNIEDLGEWLEVAIQGIKRFGEEMRPVKLTTRVFGYAAAKNDFLFEKRLQNYIFDILMQYSRGQSALVFCSTRKGAQEAAQRLSQVAMTYGQSNPFIKSKEQLERLREASLSFSDKQMQSYVLYGVGYHNGGLCLKDRNLIEGLFLNGDVQILCTTNTLAHGINLPAHTVVIKSTQHFNKEKAIYMEYDRSTILQMCGRAGRPPFDDTGTVIIMTRRGTVHLYENLLNGCEMVESQLLSCVAEHLTAEIVQLTISDIARAIEWMKCSYLYVRMKKNPEKYAVKKGITNDQIEKHMQGICVEKINQLLHHQMIWTDEDSFLLKPQEPGRLMTKYYLKFDTMKHIMKAPEKCSLEDALRIICHAEEINWIQLRRNEKKILNDLNTDKNGRLRFHINDDKGKRKKRIQTREEKIFVLTNDCLTGDPSIHDLSMTQDANSICSNGCRIAKCMKEYFIYKRSYRGAVNSTLLAKSLHQKLWDDSPYLLKQLPGIGMVTAKALHSMGVQSFDALAEADPRRIEIVTGRKYPFGNHIKESLLSLPPKVNMKVEEDECPRRGMSKLVITLTRLSQPIQSTRRHYADMIVGSEEDNVIHFHEKIRVDEFSSPYSTTILLPNLQQGKPTVKADIIFEEHIGFDVHEELLLIKEIKSHMNPKCTNKRPRFYPPPEEVCAIEADNDTRSQTSAIELQNLVKFKRANTSMPSFILLDEELGEGESATENEKDGSKIITEQTIFDHIREKAKNFSLLSIPSATCSPPPKALIPTRKRPCGSDSELDALPEIEKGKIPQESVLPSYSEPREATHGLRVNYNLTLYQQSTAGILSPMNRMDERGEVPFEPGENMLKTFSEEAVFDHIQKKSKNFPVFNASKPFDSESLVHSSKDQSESRIVSVDVSEGTNFKLLRDSFIPDLKPEGMDRDLNSIKAETGVKTNAYLEGHQRSNLPCKTSNTKSDPSAIKMLSLDILKVEKNMQLSEPGSSMEDGPKQLSPRGENRQQCLSLAGKLNEENSFLGFKSVFSFL